MIDRERRLIDFVFFVVKSRFAQRQNRLGESIGTLEKYSLCDLTTKEYVRSFDENCTL